MIRPVLDSSGLESIVEGEIDRIEVAIEVPHGAIVETLLGHLFAVYSINPKQLDRFRDCYSPSAAKDDRRDAFVMADSLRTDELTRILTASPYYSAFTPLIESSNLPASIESL